MPDRQADRQVDKQGLTCSLVVLPIHTSPIWNPASPTTGINTHTPTNSKTNLELSQGDTPPNWQYREMVGALS